MLGRAFCSWTAYAVSRRSVCVYRQGELKRCTVGCVQVRSSAVETAQTGLGVGDDGGERLVHFMGDRGRNFPERRDARYVCEIRLRLTKRFFGALLLGQGGNQCGG